MSVNEKAAPTPTTDWNQAAAQFSELAFSTEWSVGYPAVLESLGPVSGRRILDYGCGEGKLSRYLARLGAVVVGVDSSARMIELARRGDGARTSFDIIESGNLNAFKADSFDAVIACWVLCTIDSPQEIRNIGRSVSRVLKLGSPFTLIENNPSAFGIHFNSFAVDLPVKFDLDLPAKVTTHLVSQNRQDLKVVDKYWPNQILAALLQDGSDLSLASITLSASEPSTSRSSRGHTGDPPPFRILEFRRGQARNHADAKTEGLASIGESTPD